MDVGEFNFYRFKLLLDVNPYLVLRKVCRLVPFLQGFEIIPIIASPDYLHKTFKQLRREYDTPGFCSHV